MVDIICTTHNIYLLLLLLSPCIVIGEVKWPFNINICKVNTCHMLVTSLFVAIVPNVCLDCICIRVKTKGTHNITCSLFNVNEMKTMQPSSSPLEI